MDAIKELGKLLKQAGLKPYINLEYLEKDTLIEIIHALEEKYKNCQRALKSVQESMEMYRQESPKGSLSRGRFDGFFYGVDEQIKDALK